ncbi:MAG: hypothetical protein AAB250_14645, partial [Bdellovibrionota bacterium]
DDFDAEIQVEVLKTEDPVANERMSKVGVTKTIQLHLAATKEQPSIEKCELATGVACTQGALQITEGESVAVTLTVKDLGSPAGRAPRLALDDDQSENNEMPRVAGRRYTTIARKAEALGNGSFRFKGRIDTKGMEFPAGAKSAIVRVVAYAVSPSGLVSADETIDVTVTKKAEPAPQAAAPAPAANAPKPDAAAAGDKS